MSALAYVNSIVLPAALSMLPRKMDTPPARALVLAIGLQESEFKHRRQMAGGPALSFWQAEPGGGFRGLARHPATADIVTDILLRTGYGAPDPSDFPAIEHNDILACIGARLLLWSSPMPLPRDAANAWAYYLAQWRPGLPRREPWDAHYELAWRMVEAPA
jgi:hypothetical protein